MCSKLIKKTFLLRKLRIPQLVRKFSENMDRNVNYPIHTSSMEDILSQLNPLHSFKRHLSKSSVNINIQFMPQNFQLYFSSGYQWSGAFPKLRKATVSFVTSVCWSVRQHRATRLPLDEFS